jgi:hypothetical protein
MKKHCDGKFNRPSYLTIKEAINGDIEAISRIANHYQGYIIKISRIRYIDQYGRVRYSIDEMMLHQLRSKLVSQIFRFKI